MRTLKTSEAAALLNVSPNTLRAWERRFGYPKPKRSPGRHRLYAYAEVLALGEALKEGLSISSAVTFAREGIGADTHALVGALIPFREERADAAMEASLALRTLERSVDEVMLPSLNEVRRRRGATSTTWALAVRWARDWLHRARALSPPPGPGRVSILIGDAAHPQLDPAEPYIRSLELLCARGGARVLSLPVQALDDLAEVVAAARPDSVVIAGAHATDDDVANWAYRVRSATGPGPIALFHRGLEAAAAGPSARVLSVSPLRAHHELLDLIGPPHPAFDRGGGDEVALDRSLPAAR